MPQELLFNRLTFTTAKLGADNKTTIKLSLESIANTFYVFFSN
jgi:hypothetical protein